MTHEPQDQGQQADSAREDLADAVGFLLARVWLTTGRAGLAKRPPLSGAVRTGKPQTPGKSNGRPYGTPDT